MKKKLNDMRGMTEVQLMEKISSDRKELLKMKALVAGNTRPENPGVIRKLRRDVARMMTITNEKKMNPGKVKVDKKMKTEVKK